MKDEKNELLENGMDFILLSLCDFKKAKNKNLEKSRNRFIKYSLLHLSAGIELIYKHKLYQEHWTYIYKDMNKANKELFLRGDFQSVYFEDIFKRLDCLCAIKIDESVITIYKQLKNFRNKAEHFELKETYNAIESLIHKSISPLIEFLLTYDINDFNTNESGLFGKIKLEMIYISQHYEDAKSMARAKLEAKDLIGYRCPECLESFFTKDGECHFCGFKDKTGAPYTGATYIEHILGISKYSCFKEGGTFPLYICPECGLEELVIDNGLAQCFSCEYDVEKSKICYRCSEPFIPESEDSSDICKNCMYDITDNHK